MGLGGKKKSCRVFRLCTWGIVVIFFFFFTFSMVYLCCVIGCTVRWSDSDKGFFRIFLEKEVEK